jgi:hypothetical protein
MSQAIRYDGPLLFDLREEAMGDKIAATAVIVWMLKLLGGCANVLPSGDHVSEKHLTIIEDPNGRTPFMLSDYFKHDRVLFAEASPMDDINGLDLHTKGHELPSLWELNAYLGAVGNHPRLDMKGVESNGTIVFSILDRVEYNQRREMDLACARETVDLLTKSGYKVTVLMSRPDALFPEALTNLSLRDCINQIKSCSLFIGGDTGFSHLAAALKKPSVALYPDHIKFGKYSMSKAAQISEWWGLPGMMFTPMNFYPNSRQAHYAEIGTDHRWSPMRVLEIVKWYL